MTANDSQLKSEIRAKIRQLRRSINLQHSQQAGESITQSLIQNSTYQQSQSVACFISFDGEVDTRPIIQHLHQDGKTCLLPYLRPSKPNKLWFIPFNQGDPLQTNRFGIPEVQKGIQHAMRVSEIDLILIPMVAFDSHGNRLGMGGGFYDATLAHLNRSEFKYTRPTILGIGFEAQKVEFIPAESWDFQLDSVITEVNTYQFS